MIACGIATLMKPSGIFACAIPNGQSIGTGWPGEHVGITKRLPNIHAKNARSGEETFPIGYHVL
jgi:hypothetical protein